jgi:hypothetical protein
MFWGCFTWDSKGPCHIYKEETAAEKKAALKAIEELNTKLEPILKEQWELNTMMARVGLRNKRGTKPQWKWDKKHGKLERGGKGGIDWYRYRTCILEPKLIPYAKRCIARRPDTIVQEDGAASHIHRAQQYLYDLHQVRRMTWCGNSPDLNMIEPAWKWLKWYTTKQGAPQTRRDAQKRWLQAWKNLEQERIQAWIERIPRAIQEVIRCEGGNEYREGKADKQRRLAPPPLLDAGEWSNAADDDIYDEEVDE